MTGSKFNVHCPFCGTVWEPQPQTPDWYRAKARWEKGYLDAAAINCGCTQTELEPEAPYRVVGYDDMGEGFNHAFFKLVPALKSFLELARSGMYVVAFVDTHRGFDSQMQARLAELV